MPLPSVPRTRERFFVELWSLTFLLVHWKKRRIQSPAEQTAVAAYSGLRRVCLCLCLCVCIPALLTTQNMAQNIQMHSLSTLRIKYTHSDCYAKYKTLNNTLHCSMRKFRVRATEVICSVSWAQENAPTIGSRQFALPFTHEHCSRRLSVQTHSQQHRNLWCVQVRGDTAWGGMM